MVGISIVSVFGILFTSSLPYDLVRIKRPQYDSTQTYNVLRTRGSVFARHKLFTAFPAKQTVVCQVRNVYFVCFNYSSEVGQILFAFRVRRTMRCKIYACIICYYCEHVALYWTSYWYHYGQRTVISSVLYSTIPS